MYRVDMAFPISTPQRPYGVIVVHHQDFYSGWMEVADKDLVHVSPKGYPTVRNWALFEDEASAEAFFRLNEAKIRSRCANRVGFLEFEIQWVTDSVGQRVTEVVAI